MGDCDCDRRGLARKLQELADLRRKVRYLQQLHESFNPANPSDPDWVPGYDDTRLEPLSLDPSGAVPASPADAL